MGAACGTFAARAALMTPVSNVLLCHCNGKTQYLYEFSEFVILLRHLLFFHMGGMFVILINVSIFRMSREEKNIEFIHIEAVCRCLSRSNVFWFLG